MGKYAEFDFSKEIKAELKQHIQAIDSFCHQNRIPYFLTICTESTPVATKYQTEALIPAEIGVELVDDQIRKMICVKNGFEVFPVAMEEFRMDETEIPNLSELAPSTKVNKDNNEVEVVKKEEKKEGKKKGKKHEYILYLPGQIIPVKQRTAFFNELHDLDVKAYPEECAGEAITMKKRYAANTESLIFVRDLALADDDHPKGKVVGYMNFFPVDKDLQEKILNKETPFNEIDDSISPDSIVPYEDGSFIYLFSFVIDKKYRDGEVVKLMTDALKEFLEGKKREGKVGEIAACACSEDGRKSLADIGMKRHHALKEDREKEVYVAKKELLK